jgi:hypothetical protein
MVAVSAVVIAVISLLVSLRQSRIMDRQLAASVWPHLQYDTGNQSDDGKSVVRFEVENAGVGPAVIHSMSLRYKDEPVRNITDLVNLCCNDLLQSVGKPSWETDTIHDHVMIAGHSRDFLVLTDTPNNALYWKRLNVERLNVHVKVCYCSVLDQCWMLDSEINEQKSLPSCPAAEQDDYRD